jgi:hypothetical protein
VNCLLYVLCACHEYGICRVPATIHCDHLIVAKDGGDAGTNKYRVVFVVIVIDVLY